MQSWDATQVTSEPPIQIGEPEALPVRETQSKDNDNMFGKISLNLGDIKLPETEPGKDEEKMDIAPEEKGESAEENSKVDSPGMCILLVNRMIKFKENWCAFCCASLLPSVDVLEGMFLQNYQVQIFVWGQLCCIPQA